VKKIKTIIKPFLNKIVNFCKNHWKLLIFLLVILLLVIFWQFKSSQKNKAKLVFQHPEIKNIVKKLEVSGVIDAKEKARLRFAGGGKVVYLGAKEGDQVKKGKTIATIDKIALEKQLQQDLNLYSKERLDWENTRDDIKDRWIDNTEKRTVDQAQLDLNNEVIDVEIKTEAIKNSALYAPFNGVLTFSPTAVAGTQLLATDYFEIVNPNSLIFKAAVDESDISKVKAGQLAKIQLDAYEDQEFDSSVNYIAYTSSQSSTGTVFVVEFPLSNPDLNVFRIGMNGDVAITLAAKDNVLTVPYSATKERDNKFFVDVKNGPETYQEKEIQVGLVSDDEVEVISGLSENDEVLIPE
jgi:HlyD family secretion protein/macrolide-specific efflux system membrane fusion protein